jgi:hypothetical protein
MARKKVADAFDEIDQLRSDIKKLRFAVTTVSVSLLVSVTMLTYIISQIQ